MRAKAPSGNPSVSFVALGGVIALFCPDPLAKRYARFGVPPMTSDAEAVVARQLDAYNARDIDAFMAAWREDAEYFEHPDRLLARGAAEIRIRHEIRFKEPDLHGKL